MPMAAGETAPGRQQLSLTLAHSHVEISLRLPAHALQGRIPGATLPALGPTDGLCPSTSRRPTADQRTRNGTVTGP